MGKKVPPEGFGKPDEHTYLLKNANASDISVSAIRRGGKGPSVSPEIVF
jgi:hypothetical protein